MPLSEYHQNYANKTDDEIAALFTEREQEMKAAFALVGDLDFANPILQIALLGCEDKRLIQHYQDAFFSILGKKSALHVLDASILHLVGEYYVLQHDVIEPLPTPNGPYEVIYGDGILHSIKPTKQAQVLKNVYEALAPGGVALLTFSTSQEKGESLVDEGAIRAALAVADPVPLQVAALHNEANAHRKVFLLKKPV